ncbi:MAG: queuosine salvage family protein [Anaerolineae bacterium]
MNIPDITVNTEQARRMGQRLIELDWKSAGYDTLNAALPAGSDRAEALSFFFFTSMLLFDFKNIETTLPDGRYIKGTDVFFFLAKRAGETRSGFWSAATLARLSDDDFLRAFSLTNDPVHPDMPRMDERIALLRDAAQVLISHWQGSVSTMLDENRYLRPTGGGGGLLNTLITHFKGYSDTLFKKVFVFLKAADVLDLWHPLDPENVMMPVDYHVIRLALRNGTVTVHDERLAAQLRGNEPVSAEDEQRLREVVMEAYHEMIRSSGLSVYFIDEVFWLVGRSCCHYKRPPRCTTCDYSDCTVQPALSYACPGKCPLAATCLGARDDDYRSLLEPNIVTTYY